LAAASFVLRVRDRLALGRLAHETLAALRKSDDGGSGACSLGIFENSRFATLHHGHAGVGGAEVDA
jgi:hypothetical protein